MHPDQHYTAGGTASEQPADGSAGSAAPTGAGAGSRRDSGPPVEVVAHLQSQLVRLQGLTDRPLAEHAELFDQVHAELQAALAQIDGG